MCLPEGGKKPTPPPAGAAAATAAAAEGARAAQGQGAAGGEPEKSREERDREGQERRGGGRGGKPESPPPPGSCAGSLSTRICEMGFWIQALRQVGLNSDQSVELNRGSAAREAERKRGVPGARGGRRVGHAWRDHAPR